MYVSSLLSRFITPTTWPLSLSLYHLPFKFADWSGRYTGVRTGIIGFTGMIRGVLILINVIKKYSRRDKIFKVLARSTHPPPEICGALAL